MNTVVNSLVLRANLPLCVFLCMLMSVQAEAVEPVSPIDPAVIGRNLEESGAPSLPAEEDRKALIEQLQVEQEDRGQGENQVTSGLQFVLNGVKVQGNSVLKNEDIISLVQPYIEKPADVQLLQQIASKITQLYAQQGYVTSRCVIPPQKAVDGVVLLKMEENRLGRIVLKGKNSYRYNPNLFTRYLHDLPGQVIHIETLNERLRQLAKLPVTRVTPSLQAARQGVSNLVLEITDREDEYSLTLDNQGSKFTGVHRLSFSANIGNFTGNGDPLALRMLVSAKDSKLINSLSADYVRPMGEKAGRLRSQLDFSSYQLDEDEIGPGSNILYNGNSSSLRVMYEEPFFLNTGNYWWTTGFEHRRVEAATVSNNNNPLYKAGEKIVDGEDLLSVLLLSARIDYNDNWIKNYRARNVASIQLKHGLEGFLGSMTQEDIDHKTANLLDPGAIKWSGPIGNVDNMDPDFSKLYLKYGRQQLLPDEWVLLLNTAIEYTDSERVPDSYKFVGAGGGTNGYSASLGVSHSLGSPHWQASLSYNTVTARNVVADSWTSTDADTFIFTVGYLSKKWSAYYTALSNEESFDTIDEKHRFYLSLKW